MRESRIETAVVAFAEKRGWLSYKFNSPGNSGVPDRIFIKDGQVTFVEFKAPGKITEPLQKAQIKRIRNKGVKVFTVDNVIDGKTLIIGEML